MKTNNEKYPSTDFFNFEVYPFPKSSDWQLKNPTNVKIAVLLQNASEDDLVLLAKIFKAVGKDSKEDVLCINDSNVVAYKDLIAQHDVEKILVFGMQPKTIGLHLKCSIYQIIRFQEREIIFAHSLAEIASDLNKKKQFWSQLQVLFAV